MLFSKAILKKNLMKIALCACVAAGIAAMPLAGATAYAAPTLNMSTDYPGISAKAGEVLSFDLKLQNNTDTGESAALSVDSIPGGWKANFEANGSQVSRVYVDGINAVPTSSYSSTAPNQTTVTFNVAVPQDAQNGKYNIALSAAGEKGDRAALNLEINVTDEQVSQNTFTSQFQELQGSNSTSFTYSMNLSNKGTADTAYSLSSTAPDGWNVAFTDGSSGQQIASISVKKQGTAALSVKVTPPADATAGKYPITVMANSGKESLSAELSVNITGSYSMTLTTASERFNADAYIGQESPVTFILTNTGSSDIGSVNLTASAPTGWVVRFDPVSVESIAAGQSAQVTAYVTPARDAITGDYQTTFTASASGSNVRESFRITVKTASVWGYVAIIIIIALVLVLLLVFKKFGRR